MGTENDENNEDSKDDNNDVKDINIDAMVSLYKTIIITPNTIWVGQSCYSELGFQ